MNHEDEPKGTIVILLVYIVILAMSWGGIYLLLLQRGGGYAWKSTGMNVCGWRFPSPRWW